MDAKVLFWTGALANMGVIVGLAAAGIRARRAGAIARHRRCMLSGVALVFGFVAAYALKLAFLGREDLSVWSRADVWILRFHECCVAVMIVAGALAVWRGRKVGRTRNATGDPADPPAPPALARAHRRAGWTSVAGAVAGFLSAALVLLGMYQRAGLL